MAEDMDDIDVNAPRVPDGTRPMESAPAGDGWILGLVDQDGAYNAARQPWAILTRGDRFPNGDEGGCGIWVDDDGNERTPRAWIPLPDPQPERTGWFPVEGTIHIEPTTMRVVEKDGSFGAVVPNCSWIIYVVRLNGETDEYRDYRTAADIEGARVWADKMARRYGLPVVEHQPPPARLAVSNSGIPKVKRITPPADGPRSL